MISRMVVKIIIGPIQKVWHSKTRNFLPPFPMLHLVIFHFESLPPGVQQVTSFELKIGRLLMRTAVLSLLKWASFLHKMYHQDGQLRQKYNCRVTTTYNFNNINFNAIFFWRSDITIRSCSLPLWQALSSSCPISAFPRPGTYVLKEIKITQSSDTTLWPILSYIFTVWSRLFQTSSFVVCFVPFPQIWYTLNEYRKNTQWWNLSL